MSLLKSDDISRMGDFLKSDGQSSEVVAPETQDVNVNVGADDKSDIEVEVETTQVEAPEVETTVDHDVPYSRFKQVVETKNRYQSELNAYQKKIAELERKQAEWEAQSRQEPEVEDDYSWLDDFDDDPQPQVDNRYEQLESRLRKYEVQQAMNSLQKEIDDIGTKYPNVPKNVLLEAVQTNGNVDLYQVAEIYSQWVAEIQEAAIADYAKKAKKPAMPRVATTSTPSKQTVAPQKKQKPKTIKEASRAFADFLKGQKDW